MVVMRLLHWRTIPTAALAALAAAPAWAQEVDDAPETAMTQSVFIVVALVLAAMVAGVSFMSSRRGHQD